MIEKVKKRSITKRLRTLFVVLKNLSETLEKINNREQEMSSALCRIEDELIALRRNEDNINQALAVQKDIVQKIEKGDAEFVSVITSKQCQSNRLLRLLKLHLSVHPTIWGKEERLHIASTAAVSACFFNTNSGHITIGEYTFSGSGVSILAGSHDPSLTGFLRRDAEMTEGCDIIIGNGVWLASNSTILGPCTIGDNAVIAAGAVVVPNTNVPANTFYGGVPAKKISDICYPNETDDMKNPAILQALQRNCGALFLKGWTEKKRSSLPYLLHPLQRKGILLLSHNKWNMLYTLEKSVTCQIEITGSKGLTTLEIKGASGQMEVLFPCDDHKLEKVTIKSLTDSAVLSIALVAISGE